MQNTLLKQTVLQMALSHVPAVRARFGALGLDARLFKGIDHLDRLPLWSRRDVFDPRKNPDGGQGLVLRGTEEGVKRFSDRSVLRRIAFARLVGGEEVQELAIEAATRAIHMHLAPGPGGRIPIAYTRDDLDLFARAGARLAQLTGVAREDRLLNLVPAGPALTFWGIFYMAHGTGMTGLHLRREGQDLARAIASSFGDGPTSIALPSEEILTFVPAARDAGIDLSAVRAVIAVGRSLTTEERGALGEQLLEADARDATIAAAYGPAEGRSLWGECAVPAGRTETFGFHTFPDLDLVEVVDPQTGARLGDETPGEIVVTPLGFRGGGVPRWRTGDLALGGLSQRPCPNCARSVPRVGPAVERAAWARVATRDGRRGLVDLRDVGSAASERSQHWQVELVEREGVHDLFVYLAHGEDPAPLIDLHEDLVRMRAEPTQIVLGSPEQIQARIAQAGGPWPRLWEH